jgi:hypothetical protein
MKIQLEGAFENIDILIGWVDWADPYFPLFTVPQFTPHYPDQPNI